MPLFEFSMMEIATAQVSGPVHQKALGKGLSILAGPMRKQLESHAQRGSSTLDVLLISDTLYGELGPLSERPGGTVLDKLRQTSAGLALAQRIRKMAFGERPDQEVAALLLSVYNEPLGENSDPFDLHRLYTLLSTADVSTPGLQWNLQRTVFKDPSPSQAQREPQGLVYEIEQTIFDAERRSVFWNSNDPLPGEFRGRFDLIAARRCVCYCEYTNAKGQQTACCGCARDDESDVDFLLKVAAALRETETSAAYLGGIMQAHSPTLKNWQQAVKQFELVKNERGLGGTVAELVDHYMGRYNAQCYSEWKSGVYLSRGRPFSKKWLKVSV